MLPQIRSHWNNFLRQCAFHHVGKAIQASETVAAGLYFGIICFLQLKYLPGVSAHILNISRLTPCPDVQEISSLTLTSGFLVVLDIFFRAGWLHSAINAATENDAVARANGRTALNSIFLIIFMNIMSGPSVSACLSSAPTEIHFCFRSAYTLYYMDRDRFMSFPPRFHPFSLAFWRMGRKACAVIMGFISLQESSKVLELCVFRWFCAFESRITIPLHFAL
jgi:hypothetical protein